MKQWVHDLGNKSFGRGTHSQSYQDELLDVVFANVGTRNSPPFCVEFGFDSTSLTQGSGANVAALVLRDGWKCLLIDGENENPAINLRKHYLSSSNVCDVFRSHGVPAEPEYISIDVDSTDLWLFEAVVKNYRAMVFSVEYNCNYPVDAAVTFPNDPDEHWQGDRGYAASLKALTLVAERHGYSLLWVVPGLDAFFIRNDLIDDGSGRICFPISTWRWWTGIPLHPPLKDRGRLGMFIDYEVYLRTSGDLARSREHARPVCQRYLLGNDDFIARACRKLGECSAALAAGHGHAAEASRRRRDDAPGAAVLDERQGRRHGPAGLGRADIDQRSP